MYALKTILRGSCALKSNNLMLCGTKELQKNCNSFNFWLEKGRCISTLTSVQQVHKHNTNNTFLGQISLCRRKNDCSKNAKGLYVAETQKRCIRRERKIKRNKKNNEHFFLSPKAIVNSCPENYQPYLRLVRLDRPIGSWLLFLPCTWSISLAAPAGALPDISTLLLFGVGAILMRGAGCTINDMWDKDFDAKVERTKGRPLPSEDITPFQALTFLGLQLSAALTILLTFNWYTVFLGASSVILVAIYPLMKRFTYWPQAFLGLTINWGALLGWSAINGYVNWSAALPLYAGCIAWTMIYDTIYAHQDKADDILIGVKSTALKFGEQTKPLLAAFTATMIGCLTTTGVMCEQTWLYYLGVSVVAAHLSHQIYQVNLNNPEDCGKTFRSNRNLGLFFWASIVLSNLLMKEDSDTNCKEL